MGTTTASAWTAIDDNVFGVLGFVNAHGEPRSAGVVYVVDDRSLLITTGRDSWKVRHIERTPAVAMTVAIPKRVPFMPWIKVPAATVTFHGEAEILEVDALSAETARRLFRSNRVDDETRRTVCVIRVVPRGHFVTYGIDMPVMRMADHERARKRVPCGSEDVTLHGRS